MSSQQYTNPWSRYGTFIGATIPLLLLILAVFLAAKTVGRNAIRMNGSEEYSFRGLIKAHGYITNDMLGPVPLELPLLLEYLYRGRTLLLDDPDLFTSKVLGMTAKPNTGRRLSLSPSLADAWRASSYRQLVYNPFTYSDRVRLGEPLSRTSWPALIRLLPPIELSEAHGSVLVTEVDGVVYFVPTEWFDRPASSQALLFGDKLVEPLLVAVMWLVGWCFIRWACGSTLSFYLSVGAALPVGMGLWGIFYWSARSILGRSLVLGCPGLMFGLFTLFAVLPIATTKSFRADLRRYAPSVVCMVSAVMVLALALMRFGSFIPTVDSFRLLSSENSPAASLTQGFPIVLSSISALGVVTGQGFLGTIYPLLFLSLVLITAAAFYRLQSLYPTRGWARLVAALILILFFVLTPMARLQFSYVNGHVFTACCLLTLLLLLLESRSVRFDPPSAYGHTVCVFLLALLVSMSRMEGSLLTIVILATILLSGVRVGRASGRFMPAAAALAVVTWGVVMVRVLKGQAFVSSGQYVALSALAALLGLLSLLDPAGVICRWIARYGTRIMVLGSITVAYAVHVLQPAHMSASTSSVLSNLIVQNEGWGYFWWFVVAIIPVCWWNPSLARSRVDVLREVPDQHAQRVLLTFFALALLATIVIGLFRQPYRVGWSDSANRIIFQLVPVLLVWLYGAIGSSLRMVSRTDSSMQKESAI
jgi:hypothetical protein